MIWSQIDHFSLSKVKYHELLYSLTNSFDPNNNVVSNEFDPKKNGLTYALSILFDPKNWLVTVLTTDSNLTIIIQLVKNSNTVKLINTNNLNGFVS